MGQNNTQLIDLKKIIQNVWNRKPVVQCITNFVTVNDCANIILAIGGSPTMAHDLREAADIASGCQALVLNMGNVADTDAMISAGKKSNEIGIPVIMDPVGVGGSPLRRETFQRMSELIHFSVIRGNASEIKYIATGIANGTSVDAEKEDEITEENVSKFVTMAKMVAKQLHCVIAISGKIDIIADQNTAFVIKNGDAIMSRVTGTGCMLTALMAAVCGGNKDQILDATTAAVLIMNTSGEIAVQKTNLENGGTMTFRTYLLDNISKAYENTTINKMIQRANYERF